MASKKELLELKRLLEDINRQYKSLNKISPFKGQDAAQFVKAFENGGDAIASATISLKAMRAEVAGVETGLDNLRETFRNNLFGKLIYKFKSCYFNNVNYFIKIVNIRLCKRILKNYYIFRQI